MITAFVAAVVLTATQVAEILIVSGAALGTIGAVVEAHKDRNRDGE